MVIIHPKYVRGLPNSAANRTKRNTPSEEWVHDSNSCLFKEDVRMDGEAGEDGSIGEMFVLRVWRVWATTTTQGPVACTWNPSMERQAEKRGSLGFPGQSVKMIPWALGPMGNPVSLIYAKGKDGEYRQVHMIAHASLRTRPQPPSGQRVLKGCSR